MILISKIAFILLLLSSHAYSLNLREIAIGYFTGFNGHNVSFDRAEETAHILIEKNDVVGSCILGSIQSLTGNLKDAQLLYFDAFASGDLLRFVEKEPIWGHFFMGEYYMVSEPPDFSKANLYYKLSADAGFAPAMANYGINRLLGHGIEKDQKDGKKYLLNAMEEDIPVAYYNYAMNLLSIEKARKETAKAYLEYASSRGFKIADVALKDWF